MIVAAFLGIVVVAALWWAYFDVVALYLVALSAFKRRNYGSFNRPRLAAFETLHYAEARERIRHS